MRLHSYTCWHHPSARARRGFLLKKKSTGCFSALKSLGRDKTCSRLEATGCSPEHGPLTGLGERGARGGTQDLVQLHRAPSLTLTCLTTQPAGTRGRYGLFSPGTSAGTLKAPKDAGICSGWDQVNELSSARPGRTLPQTPGPAPQEAFQRLGSHTVVLKGRSRQKQACLISISGLPAVTCSSRKDIYLPDRCLYSYTSFRSAM